MASGTRTLKLSILADIAGLSKGLNQGTNEVQGFGSKMADFGKKAAVAFAAAGIAAAAFAVKFAKDAIVAGEAASTANSRIEQINKSMGLFGASTGEVNKSLIAYAEVTARATGVDTNSIKATQAKLLTFKELAKTANEIGGQFERTTKAAIDLGAAGFGTAETNAVALGKALNDPIKGITALTRNGITFTEVEKNRIKTLVESNKVGEAQNLILQAIETQVGGTAEATANATDKMRVGFTQVQEKVGLALLPVFEKLTNFVIDVVFPAFDKIGQQFAGLTSQLGENVVPAFQNLVTFFQDYLLPVFEFWWGFITDIVIPGLENFFTPILEGLGKAFSSVTSTIKDNQAKLAPLLDLFKGVWDFVGKYLAPIMGTVLGTAFNVAGKAISAVITIVANFIGIITSAVNAVKALASAMASIMGGVGGFIGGAVSSLFGGGKAAGGPVRSGTSYLVGERGPELFTPSSGGSITPSGGLGGNTYNITVNGALDGEGVARQIVETLNDSYYRGTLGGGAVVGAFSTL
jgi:phage-related protein